MDSHLAHHFTNHNNKIKCQELSELWAQLGQSNWPRMENFSNAFYGHFTTQNLCGKRDGWTDGRLCQILSLSNVKKNRQNWPKIDEANEEHNKWHTYKYVLYLSVCVCVGCALHLPILWPLHKLTKGSAWRVTVGDTFLLLLLRPSCLSFARTNKIKLNCLKIAKNEAKCQRGLPIRRRRTAQKPKWLWTSRTQWESGCLWGLGGKGVTAQVACFFVDPSASQNSPSKRWQRARIKAFCAGIEYWVKGLMAK